MSDLDERKARLRDQHRYEMRAERFAALLELAFRGRLFTRLGEASGQLYAIRKVHQDGRVQLTTYPQAPQIPDCIVEPDTLVPA